MFGSVSLITRGLTIRTSGWSSMVDISLAVVTETLSFQQELKLTLNLVSMALEFSILFDSSVHESSDVCCEPSTVDSQPYRSVCKWPPMALAIKSGPNSN